MAILGDNFAMLVLVESIDHDAVVAGEVTDMVDDDVAEELDVATGRGGNGGVILPVWRSSRTGRHQQWRGRGPCRERARDR